MSHLVVILAVLSVWLIQMTQQTRVDGLSCESLSAASHCSCSIFSPTEYSFQCPMHSPSVEVTFKHQEMFQMQCIPNLSHLIDTLSGLHIGNVKKFMLRLCPLPDSSIKELMASVGIDKIEMLQIQTYGNLSDTLKKSHFENLTEITSLSFNNNGYTVLPRDIFEDMGNLTWLDMKYNDFVLPKDIFSFTPKLDVLELGKNNLTNLKPGTFKKLERLRLLNLWGNKLTNLTRDVFSDIPNLISLDLNSNGMTTIRPDLFADLRKLEKLNLHSNAFISLPQGLLSGNIELVEFQIQDNRRVMVTLPPGFFSNLPKLSMIKLSGSKITRLPEDTFWESKNIRKLHLNQNSLRTLPGKIFRDLEALEYLDLSENHISDLPEELFSNTKALTFLKMSYNQIKEIPENIFSHQTSLEFLDFRFNKIKEIKGNQFYNLASLKTLNISDNELTTLAPDHQLSDFGNYSVLKNCHSLTDLQLANNSLFELYGDWRLVLKKLSVVNLSLNNFTSLVIDDLEFFGDVFIDLSNNKINRVNFWNADLHAMSVLHNFNSSFERDSSIRTRPKRFNLDNNPFTCDCLILPFAQFVKGELSPEVQYLFNIQVSNLKCHQPKNLENMFLKYVPYKALTCDLRYAKNYECPENCSCDYRPIDKGNIINCRNMGLQQLPDLLPLFAGANHSELNFEGNKLQNVVIPPNENYTNVTLYTLSNNEISNIDMAGFSNSLQHLDISHNNLMVLSSETISFLEGASKLKSILLHKNPWKCGCDAKPLITLLKSKFKQVENLHNVTCSDGRPLVKLSENELCPEILGFYAILCLIGAIIGLLMAFLTILYYNYQQEIHIYCFSSKWKILRWLVSRPDVDEEKKYDAFISYAHMDEKFVTDHLVPYLEEKGETKFKLCLHYRDWKIGDSIQMQILRSIKESRRTIVVLSPNYLQSDWGRMEFNAAYEEALKYGTTKVIVICYEDVGPIDELDESFKLYLQMNTYVKWGSNWFWQQLIYAMPHPNEDASNVKCIFGCLPRLSRNNDPMETLQNVKTISEEVHNMNKINNKLSDTKESPSIFTNPPTLIIESKDAKTKILPKESHQNGSIVSGV